MSRATRCWAIARSPRCEQLICAPGNAGTALVAENAPVAMDDIPGLVGLAKTRSVDLVVIGPEQPLADGLADALAYVGVRVFGPLKNAAEIPTPIPSWLNDTSRPRRAGGAISAM